MKQYDVLNIRNEDLIINGKGDHSLWNSALVLTDFVSAWDSDPVKKIEFKSLWNSKKIYFLFKVFDSKVHIDKKDDSVISIGNSDRVELFFRANKQLNPYYCLEIDPSPRVMDFIAYPNKKFDFEWNWPQNDICVKSNIETEYFTVEIAISLTSLKKLNLIKENKIETGVFRAKYNKTKGMKFMPTWISWVDPTTESPNFHTPSSFGVLNLLKQNKKNHL